MNNKGFIGSQTIIETPEENSITEKPLNTRSKISNRVDINVLKSKLQETENKELKKNIFILSILIIMLATLGIYLSL
tara:strand:- start:974 stop:1204 length:231 start_codon:yes stop_codon:yes gene_type:complete